MADRQTLEEWGAQREKEFTEALKPAISSLLAAGFTAEQIVPLIGLIGVVAKRVVDTNPSF